MKINNEKEILFVIRYGLPAFILIVSFVITILLFQESKQNFEKTKQSIKSNFIEEKKKTIKEQVDNIISYVIEEQKHTEEELKKSLKTRLREAHEIIINIYKKYKDTHSKEEIKEIIKTVIKSIRFNNGRGYFFVDDKDGRILIHPLQPQLEGKLLLDYQDTRGKYVVRESLELLSKKDEAYNEWYWRKSKEDNEEYKKIGFVKNIYELNWFIGTGEYVDDFSKDIQKKVLKQIDKFRFGKNSYFVVFDEKNNYLAHAKKELIGTNSLERLKKINKENIMKKAWDIANNGGGFMSLNFPKPNTDKSFTKISYVKKVPKWNWLISTGFYLNDLEDIINKKEEELTQNFNENIQKLFLISSVFSLFLLLISFFISNKTEKRFKEYKDDLNRQLEENKKQYELLSQKSKLAAMGEMMENIAHQWRQPLSLITTASTSVSFQKDAKLLSDEFLDEALDTINNSANHLSDTIQDFRNFFKADKETQNFLLKDSIDKTLKLVSSQFEKNAIEVIKDIQDIRVENYERELLQVLLNILNNAKDALNEFAQDEKYIFIDIYKKDEYAIIDIYDTANGIKEAIKNKIFEPYFTTKDEDKGTGLGLYMSKEIVTRNLKGKLTLENTEFTYNDKSYKGAKFTIELLSED